METGRQCLVALHLIIIGPLGLLCIISLSLCFLPLLFRGEDLVLFLLFYRSFFGIFVGVCCITPLL